MVDEWTPPPDSARKRSCTWQKTKFCADFFLWGKHRGYQTVVPPALKCSGLRSQSSVFDLFDDEDIVPAEISPVFDGAFAYQFPVDVAIKAIHEVVLLQFG